jgi:DNA-binding FadR family transcriptional regulator
MSQNREAALAEHQAILDALRSRSPETAGAVAGRHIARVRRDLTELFAAPEDRRVVAEKMEESER